MKAGCFDTCDEGCPGDSPLAVALWKSSRPTAGEVWCADHKHRLAKVFNVDGHRVLCLPRHIYGYGATPVHAALVNIDHPEDFQDEWLRCKCGSWSLPRERLLSQLDRGASWIMPHKMTVHRKTGDAPEPA